MRRRPSQLFVPASVVPPAARTTVAGVPGPTSEARAALVALAAAALLAVGLPLAPASAHDALDGSTPADGSSVEVAPPSVELSFAQPPLALGSEVQVTGPDGQVVNAGDLVLAGTTVSQPLAPGLPAGEYAVVWRVTSADGHPISGELTFTAAGGAAGEPEPTATPAPTDDVVEPSPGPTVTPAEPPTLSPGTGTDTGAAGGDGGAADAGGGATPWVIGAVLALGGAAAAAWGARRRSAGAQG